MRLTYSYDCEGSWGWPEVAEGHFDDCLADPISRAYERIVALHEQYRVPAVFAFVGAYAATADQRREQLELGIEAGLLAADFGRRAGGCWEGAENFSIAERCPLVTLGSHSMTHRSFDALTVNERSWELEASAESLSRVSGRMIRDFIFPRNIVVCDPDPTVVFRRWRRTDRGSDVRRFVDLASTVLGRETNGDTKSDFMYWRQGLRGVFPDRGWRRRWMRRFEGGVADGHVHAWSHPHNFVTDPELFDRLEWLLAETERCAANVTHCALDGTPV